MKRIYLRGAVVLAALAAFGPSTLFAQNSAAQPVGTWLYTATIPGQTPADTVVLQGLETYTPGGSYVETDEWSFSPVYGLSTPSHGSWSSSSATEFLMTYWNFTYDSTGTLQGMSKIRQIATLSADGQTYTGSGDLFLYDVNGNLINSGTFTVTSTRIAVEAPGSVSARPAPQLFKSYGAALRRIR